MPTANVRDKRLRRGWTLDDLAHRCADEGVSTSASNLLRIERGQQPRPGLRVVLARLLDLDISEFERKAS